MNTRLLVRTFCAAAAALVFLGCSTASTNAPTLNPTTGAHPADWATAHRLAYLKNPESCKPCHGSTLDKTAAGGTSHVSCFGCHHPEGPHHPVGWAERTQHGRMAAMAASNGQTGFASTSFTACIRCHGEDYKGIGAAVSCFKCHTTAPHPGKPWTNGSALVATHDATDQSNASACFACHAGGNNSTRKPATPAAAGTEPGCFNNTLCHDRHL